MAKKGGQNKEVCKVYKAESRKEKNRRRRMRRHIRNHPNDAQAKNLFGQGAESLGFSARGRRLLRGG
jgi:hypothetical protein